MRVDQCMILLGLLLIVVVVVVFYKNGFSGHVSGQGEVDGGNSEDEDEDEDEGEYDGGDFVSMDE